MRIWVMAVVAVMACKKDQPSAPAALTQPAVAKSQPGKPAKPPPSKQQLADYKKHMKAGWALQKDQKWAEAVPEFEKANAAIDSDQRALSELGWSAMNAGDFGKARKADAEAVRVALDPKVKAASLYNLGLVLEKTGDKDAALKSYLASLQLRPNKTVEDAVGRLGATPETDQPLCKPGEKACDCVYEAAFGSATGDEPQCEEKVDPKIPVKTFHEYAVEEPPWSWTYLLDEHQGLVAIVAGGVDRLRVSEEIELEKADLKTIAGHQVLWVETKDTASENHPYDENSMDDADSETTQVTICVVGDDKTPTRCPLRNVPISSTWSQGRDYFDDDARAKDKGYKPEHGETVVDLTLGDDGTATVKLVKGASNPALDKIMGPHKLW
jgi:hypothetical protein